MKYAIIGLYKPENEEIETIGFSINGIKHENFTYPLINTPCKIALDSEIEIIKSNVQEQYPKDLYLVDMKAESYIGIPCLKVVGQLELLHC